MAHQGGYPGLITDRHACIGLGANLGQPLVTIRRVIARLGGHARCRALSVSPLYRTAPVGPRQPWFINGVALLEGTWEPEWLLRELRRLERRYGRDRSTEPRHGPRRLDLDLLFFGHRTSRRKNLILPHPRLHQRRFVLRPLADLAPGWHHPVLGKTVDTMLRDVDDDHPVERLPDEASTFSAQKAVTRQS